jgi:hypothetical protein
MNILIGADPEVFVKENGELISGYNLIPGTKEEPFPVQDGAVQVDGMALEFNIDPAADEESFVKNLNSVMSTLSDMIGDKELVLEAVAEFGDELISTQPLQATQLGCDPDMNAWSSEENFPPDATVDFRTASGHVHIGWTEGAKPTPEHQDVCEKLVKQLDFFLGVPSLIFDSGTKRRELYGQAGAYRQKPYGCEYRVLSNAWLKNDSLKRWVFRNVKEAFARLCSGQDIAAEYGDVQEIINTSNVEEANAIIQRFNIPMPEVLNEV